jgi:2-C-methyl-D-erythritol 2,4-cyclodiphosphate synthase
MNLKFRTGLGFDVHKFSAGRKLILGGIEIPHDKGLDGHSDADVLLHSICDAMLGALALGDIGIHFPNTDTKWKDVNSAILLTQVNEMVNSKGYEVGNLDCMIILESPKIFPFINQIRDNIASLLNISPDQISVKATTSETLGFVGRQEGAVSMATVLLVKKESNV